jgi:hypothetical protein
MILIAIIFKIKEENLNYSIFFPKTLVFFESLDVIIFVEAKELI